MQNLTPQQKATLQSFKDTGKLPKELDNLFLDDCFDELEANATRLLYPIKNKILNSSLLSTVHSLAELKQLKENYRMGVFGEEQKVIIVLTLLSRTPDGQAVMPFLNVENKEIEKNKQAIIKIQDELGQPPYSQEEREEYHRRYDTYNADLGYQIKYQPQTLDHQLYNIFTETLRTGQGFDEALKAVNLEYIKQIYL